MNNNNLRDVSEETVTNSIYWQDIQGKPEEFTPEYHTHAEYAKRYHKHNVGDILGVEGFATSDHLHDDRYYTKEEIDTIVNEVSAPSDVYWDDIKDIPEKFPALEHTHNDEYYTKEEIETVLEIIAAATDNLILSLEEPSTRMLSLQKFIHLQIDIIKKNIIIEGPKR